METTTNSEIYLKWGLVKSYDFDNHFAESNKDLCDKFLELYSRMFDGCACMFHASDKNKGDEKIKLELCDLLDKFFDLGVTIGNDWDNTIYKSKSKYRDYILSYGKGGAQ